MARKEAGLGLWDLRVEGTIQRWKSRKLVMADGPKNSTSYRICRKMLGFSDKGADNLMQERLGDLKAEGKFLYGNQHADAILGVAWFVDDEAMTKFPQDFPKEVDLVKPKNLLPIIARPEGKAVIRMKVVDSVIKFRWLIDGAFHRSWESRQTLRRVWGVEADELIYKAAVYQEMKFEQWKSGTRAGRDLSATPFFPNGTAEKQVHSQQSPPGGPLPTPPPDKLSMSDWKAKWCDDNMIDAASISLEEKEDMKVAWNLYKNV